MNHDIGLTGFDIVGCSTVPMDVIESGRSIERSDSIVVMLGIPMDLDTATGLYCDCVETF
jgi:hypothetical protein